MLPNEEEPVELERNGKRRSQPSFLVEARSRGGYSGSPVFLYCAKHNQKHGIVTIDFGSVKLLGVDWGHLLEEVEMFDAKSNILLPSKARVHSGMMAVIPIWYLEGFIKTSPRLIEQRARDDEWYLAHPPTAEVD
jgi:hypothetical protein